MPKLICPCGFVHDLSPIPDDGWQTIRDKNAERYVEAEIVLAELQKSGVPYSAATHQQFDMIVAESIGLLYECPRCGRIMWKKPLAEEFIVYAIDSNEDGHLTSDAEENAT